MSPTREETEHEPLGTGFKDTSDVDRGNLIHTLEWLKEIGRKGKKGG